MKENEVFWKLQKIFIKQKLILKIKLEYQI